MVSAAVAAEPLGAVVISTSPPPVSTAAAAAANVASVTAQPIHDPSTASPWYLLMCSILQRTVLFLCHVGQVVPVPSQSRAQAAVFGGSKSPCESRFKRRLEASEAKGSVEKDPTGPHRLRVCCAPLTTHLVFGVFFATAFEVHHGVDGANVDLDLTLPVWSSTLSLPP